MKTELLDLNDPAGRAAFAALGGQPKECAMADDWGLLENWDEPACCSQCESELEWVECEQCGGDGEYDAWEDDPLWFDPGDTEPCAMCGGASGWYWCPTCQEED